MKGESHLPLDQHRTWGNLNNVGASVNSLCEKSRVIKYGKGEALGYLVK